MSITLQGDLTNYQVTGLREPLIAQLESAADVAIDLQAVKKVDIAGVQLLLALKKSAELQKKHFQIDNANANLRDAVRAVGFEKDLFPVG